MRLVEEEFSLAWRPIFNWPLIAFAFHLAACNLLMSGEPASNTILDGPIEGLTPAQLRTFIAGDEAFSDVFTVDRGLGPLFNQPACIRCHTADGKGHPSTNLLRFGKGDAERSTLFDYMEALGGPQLQPNAVNGYEPETLPADISAISERSGPIVVGLGLIEAIPEEEILSYADPNDRNGDGIRGVPNYVTPPVYVAPTAQHTLVDGTMLARFGRKATAITLLQQTVSAYHADMGITSSFEPHESLNPKIGPFSDDPTLEPEVDDTTIRNVVFYLQTLRPPERRNLDDPIVQDGERRFEEIGCASCHVPSMKTGEHPLEILRFKEVALYSDLLLHDMGDALADRFPEGAATGRQWRTTPLWGLGLADRALGGKSYYLHDGRARSLDEAIRLHGGEATSAREAFFQRTVEEQEAIIAFLKSL